MTPTINEDQQETREWGRPAAVYRLYDEDGELLYVGSSYDPEKRCKDHRKEPWWSQVAQRTVVWQKTRADAFAKEAKAIRAERPRYNQACTPEYAERYRQETSAAGNRKWRIAAAGYALRVAVERKARQAGLDSAYAGAVTVLAERAFKIASGEYPNGVNHPPLRWVDDRYSRTPSRTERKAEEPAA